MDQLLKELAQSDALPILREALGEYQIFISVFSQIFQTNIILDANIVLADIRWLASKRQKLDSRSALLEVLECETVIAYAPSFLMHEVEKNIPKIAGKYSILVDDLMAQWDRYKMHIKFVSIPEATEEELSSAQDPKDVSYIKLQNLISARIYSNDTDIPAMNGRIISGVVIARLRDYSRSAAAEYHLKFAGAASVFVTYKMVSAAAQLMKTLTSKAQRLPPWGIWLGAIIIIAAIMHPKTRGWASAWAKSLPQSLSKPSQRFLEIIIPLIQVHEQAKSEAEASLQEVTRIMEAS